MTNIAIVGKMYAGKTTLAESLWRVGYYNRVLMAGPLKALARLAFDPKGGIDKGTMYDTSYGPKSGRQILQEVGQSMKTVDRDFWLKCFFNDIANMEEQEADEVRFVVDDVRFKFEADALRSKGWAIVKVQTDEKVRLERGKLALGRPISEAELGHESEKEVDSIEYDYSWDGTTDLDKYDDIANNLLYFINIDQHVGVFDR